jgi:hypothetical protein
VNKRATLALFLAATAGSAAAQFGGRRRGGMGGQEKGGEKGADKGSEPRVNSLEVTAHELHEDLKLTPEQEPLWESYLEKVRALGNDVARDRNRGTLGSNLPAKIDRIVDIQRNRLTALEDIAQAAKDLYAKLSPEQRPAADPRLANLMSIPLSPAGARGPA